MARARGATIDVVWVSWRRSDAHAQVALDEEVLEPRARRDCQVQGGVGQWAVGADSDQHAHRDDLDSDGSYVGGDNGGYGDDNGQHDPGSYPLS